MNAINEMAQRMAQEINKAIVINGEVVMLRQVTVTNYRWGAEGRLVLEFEAWDVEAFGPPPREEQEPTPLLPALSGLPLLPYNPPLTEPDLHV